MIWPWLMGFAALAMVAASVVRDWWAVNAAALILLAFVGTRVSVALFYDSQFMLVVQAAIWLMVAVAIPRQKGRKVAQVRGLIALSVACYPVARAAGIEPAIGAWPYVASDLLVIVAMIIIGWRGFVGFHGGVRDLVGHYYRRIMDDRGRTVRYLSGAKK